MTKRGKAKRKIAPGVILLANGQIHIRAKRTDPRTGRAVELDRSLPRGTTPTDAILERRRWIEGLVLRRKEAAEEQVTVRDFATSWLRGKWTNLAPGTRDRYVRELDSYVFDSPLADLLVGEVRVEDVKDWQDGLRRRGLRASTINAPLRTMRSIFKAALPRHGLRFNPADYVPALKVTDSRISEEEPNSLTEDEARRLVASVRQLYPQHEAIVVLLMTTSVRFGELRALRWEDIDFEAGVIRVRRRLSGDNSEVVEGTKGKGRKKTIPLHPEAARLLEVDRGIAGWVFRGPTGKPLSRGMLRKPLIRAAKHAGIKKRITPHGLRRSANDWLRAVSDPIVVRSITGHCTEAMTEHYSTVKVSEKTVASRRAFDPLFAKSGDQSGEEPILVLKEKKPASSK